MLQESLVLNKNVNTTADNSTRADNTVFLNSDFLVRQPQVNTSENNNIFSESVNINPVESNGYSDETVSRLNVVSDTASNVDGFSSLLGGTAITEVSPGDFAGENIATQNEISNLANSVIENDGFEVDMYGVIRSRGSSLRGTEATGVSPGDFAGEGIASQQEINALTSTILNDGELFVHNDGVISEDNSPLQGTSATGISPGDFAGEGIASQQEINALTSTILNDGELFVHNDGVISEDNSPLQGTSATGISPGDFAAQWYEKNERLFKSEIAFMKKRFPDAEYKFLPNGNMYWLVKLKISKTDAFEPWTFMLMYTKDYPKNTDNYAGPIKAVPVKPDFKELERRVRESKQKYFTETVPLPHVLNYSDLRHLCTRAQEKIADGRVVSATAVQTAAWAAEWALYFELAMRDNRVWNKWVDDEHFRKWIIR